MREFLKALWCGPLAVLLLSSFASAQLLNQRPAAPPRPMTQVAPPAKAAPNSTPTFRSSSRLVVVDVVATDHDGSPLSGLNQADFSILEDGKPEELRVFERHIPAKQLAAVSDLHLGADEFTNFPKQPANSAVNVVLFDILNTPTDDQLFARQQMIDFLKSLPRGQRVALFTLGYDLKMVAGFTTSTDELIAAAMKVKPGVSALLDTEHDLAMEDHIQQVLHEGRTIGDMAQRMKDFSEETRLVRTDIRVEKTFESLGQLARALSGYTGAQESVVAFGSVPGSCFAAPRRFAA